MPRLSQSSTRCFCTAFQLARLAKRMTQQDVANAVGVTENVIRSIETGTIFPDPLLLSALNQALDSSLKQTTGVV